MKPAFPLPTVAQQIKKKHYESLRWTAITGKLTYQETEPEDCGDNKRLHLIQFGEVAYFSFY